MNLGQIRGNWWIHALYLTNFQLGFSGNWGSGADHFWSLCTEEQFYLLWFFVVVVLPRRYFVPSIVAASVVTLAFRLGVYFGGWSLLCNVLLPGNLVSLTTGAMLAYSANNPAYTFVTRAALSPWWLGITCLGFFFVSSTLDSIPISGAVLYPFSAAAFFCCLVYTSAMPGRNKVLDWLANPVLRHIGKISYGIFVYHNFLPDFLRLYPSIWPPSLENTWPGFILLSVLSILMTQMSWTFMDRPVLRFKDIVPYPEGSNL